MAKQNHNSDQFSLFPDAVSAPVPKPKKVTRQVPAEVPASIGLVLTDHVCRCCFSRLLKRGLGGYLCPNCGAETKSQDVSDLCACGASTNQGQNLGLTCQPNPNKSAANPVLFVATTRRRQLNGLKTKVEPIRS